MRSLRLSWKRTRNRRKQSYFAAISATNPNGAAAATCEPHGLSRLEIEALAPRSLRDSFFSNKVSDLFGEPVDQKGAILGLPYQMAGVVFVEYQKLLAIDDGLLASQPDDLCSAFDMVMTACRAIIAVSSPSQVV